MLYLIRKCLLEKVAKVLYYSQVMKYAVIELGGTQFKVTEGDTVKVSRMQEAVCRVLLFKDDANFLVGSPYVDTCTVSLAKAADKADTKVVVARYKSKSRYRRKKGHRQPISLFKVDSIKLESGGVETKAVEGQVAEAPKKRAVKKKVAEE